MQIQVRNTQKRHHTPVREIRKAAEKILNALGCPEDTGLSISITGDRGIRIINRQWLGKDRPTNVISFSLQEGEQIYMEGNMLGDVVISADTAAREALESGITSWERVVFLLMHGILHLCGYDHERSGETEARKMSRKEKDLYSVLEQAGFTRLPEKAGQGGR